uniref:Uncharacterized protein n=1 Tax=Schizaphis graminum TaxID=13262 RepID=A0A2S2P1C1_SCHGA
MCTYSILYFKRAIYSCIMGSGYIKSGNAIIIIHNYNTYINKRKNQWCRRCGGRVGHTRVYAGLSIAYYNIIYYIVMYRHHYIILRGTRGWTSAVRAARINFFRPC